VEYLFFMATLKPSRKEYANIMTEFNKFIPKMPETRTEIVQEQQLTQRSITKKVVDSVTNAFSTIGEAIVPTVYAASDEDDVAKGVATATNAAAVGVATAANPLLGVVVGGLEAAAGGIMKSSNDEQAQEVGEVFSNASAIGGGIGGAASAGMTAAKQGIDAVVNEAVKNAGEAAAKGASQALGS